MDVKLHDATVLLCALVSWGLVTGSILVHRKSSSHRGAQDSTSVVDDLFTSMSHTHKWDSRESLVPFVSVLGGTDSAARLFQIIMGMGVP